MFINIYAQIHTHTSDGVHTSIAWMSALTSGTTSHQMGIFLCEIEVIS